VFYVNIAVILSTDTVACVNVKVIKMRHPKTPDLDIMNGVHVIRSLHVKKQSKFCNLANFNPTTSADTSADSAESKRPTWLVFDKQVSKRSRLCSDVSR